MAEVPAWCSGGGAAIWLGHGAFARSRGRFTAPMTTCAWQLAVQLESGPSQYSSIVMLPNGSAAIEIDAGCQASKDPTSHACDKSARTREDFFIVTLAVGSN